MGTRETMDVLTGVVVDGRVVLEGDCLPNGTRVAVRVLQPHEDGDTFEVTPDEKAELLASIEEAERGEGMNAHEHLLQLREGASRSDAG